MIDRDTLRHNLDIAHPIGKWACPQMLNYSNKIPDQSVADIRWFPLPFPDIAQYHFEK